MNDIEAVKQRADIVDIISQYVPLRRSGRTFKAPCPFHQEKTPSFVVNPDRQTWHCFGACSTGGDVFQFLMRRENLTFGEALRQLAGQLGVELRSGGDGGPREDHSRLYEANEAAAQYFRHLLLNAEAAAAARGYVERRGVDGATAEAFQLGYALNSYEALRAHLAERGFTTEEMVQAGLLTEGERGAYDRFRDRLIFPIRDERGRAIGFGGRVLGDGMPKYLNSPQTPVFDKSGTLYALDRARDAIRAAGSAVVVEGYMDVIAAHQHGITNVVATLGTALTEKHVQILKRYTRRVTLAMDADAAGQEAMSRGLAVLDGTAKDADAPLETTVDWRGMVRLHAVSPVEVAVFTVPQGKDPDDLIRADPDAFTRLAEAAVSPFDFRLRHELGKVDRSNPRALLEVADRLLPVVAGVSDRALQARYLSDLAGATGVREEDLRGRLRDADGTRPAAAPLALKERARPAVAAPLPEPEEGVAPTRGPAASTAAGVLKQEMLCLRLLYSYAGLRTDGMLLEEDLFTDAANRYLFQVWRASPDLSRVPDLLDDTLASALRAVLQMEIPRFDEAKAARALADVTARIRFRRKEEEKRLSAVTLREAEGGVDRAAMLELARAFLAGEDSLPQEGAESEAALQALRDLQAGMELHRLEAALRTGEKKDI
jgi:DNA primase